MNAADKGCLTEAILLAELLRRSYTVLKPVHNHSRYDLVIEVDGGFKKLQCKTGRLENGRVIFNTHSLEWQTGRVARHRHYRGEIDFFLVYCHENGECYLVPTDDAGTVSCSLRIEPTKNNQSKKVLWASTYRI